MSEDARPVVGRKRPLRWAASALVGAIVVGMGWWAVQHAFAPPTTKQRQTEPVVVEVVEASVGRSLSLNVTVRQPVAVVATNHLAGTVTSVDAGDEVRPGDVLYTVDTLPVRAVVGQTPFWRDLVPGFDGADVRQLQQVLSDLGHYHGTVDGRYQWDTTAAVEAWQRELGIPVTGTVRLGELVAVPRLPARLTLGEAITAGAQVSGGEPAVYATTGEIHFRLVVSTMQADLIPPDATIMVRHGDLTWEAVLGESSMGNDGNLEYELTAPDGGLVCGDECGQLPAAERTTLRAQVTIVPEITGPAVPVAAVRTDPDGTAWVRMADGDRREVTVLGSSGGVAVLDGVTVGDRVQVFEDPGDRGGGEDAAGGPPAAFGAAPVDGAVHTDAQP